MMLSSSPPFVSSVFASSLSRFGTEALRALFAACLALACVAPMHTYLRSMLYNAGHVANFLECVAIVRAEGATSADCAWAALRTAVACAFRLRLCDVERNADARTMLLYAALTVGLWPMTPHASLETLGASTPTEKLRLGSACYAVYVLNMAAHHWWYPCWATEGLYVLFDNAWSLMFCGHWLATRDAPIRRAMACVGLVNYAFVSPTVMSNPSLHSIQLWSFLFCFWLLDEAALCVGPCERFAYRVALGSATVSGVVLAIAFHLDPVAWDSTISSDALPSWMIVAGPWTYLLCGVGYPWYAQTLALARAEWAKK